MALVKVDSQRRIYIPKNMPFKADKAIIVPYSASFLLIPLPEKIIEIDVKASIQELKKSSTALSTSPPDHTIRSTDKIRLHKRPKTNRPAKLKI